MIPFLIRKLKRLLKSESCALHCGLITNDERRRFCSRFAMRSRAELFGTVRTRSSDFAQLRRGRMTRLRLFLNDLGVLDHRDAAALGHLAF